ncbi:MAG: GSCFA domain-containing protein [Flavobacteriaceae bacterium]|nr:GSCFA domain-containing protein [Flavobacteriaceae bacterium]
MNLQTKISLSKQSKHLIDYESNMLLLGSCFAENIGKKLSYFKFKNSLSPLGILFHPLAIENLITRAINKDYYSDDEVFEHHQQWHCYDAHSCLSAHSKEELLQRLNKAIDLTNRQIHESTYFMITLGTAWVYRHIESDKIVANCHKVPQKKFAKELLPVDVIQASLQAIVGLVRAVNKNVRFIFTVSPVRHIKDGYVENQRSKSHLITALHEVVAPRKHNFYFPSYEIMMDELRDYRFYAEDMIHPSPLAIDYIWECFKAVWIGDNAKSIMQVVETIQRGLAHQPFNPNSEAHQKFLENLESKITKLKAELPDVSF